MVGRAAAADILDLIEAAREESGGLKDGADWFLQLFLLFSIAKIITLSI